MQTIAAEGSTAGKGSPSFAFIKDENLRQMANKCYRNAVFDTQEKFETKKSFIQEMGGILQMDNYERTKISAKLKEIFGNIIDISTIQKASHELGYTRPYGKSGKNTDSNSSDSDHDGEPEEYKEPTFKERCEQDPASVPYRNIRWPYWHAFAKMREIAKICMDELEKDFDIETTETGGEVQKPRDWNQLFEDSGARKEYHKAIADVFYNIELTSKKCIDKRQSILPFMLLPFKAKLSTATIKHFASKYFAHIKADLTDITTKKTTQFVKSEESISALLESIMDDGWKWGCLDMKCPNCKKQTLKVKIMPDGTWKFICKNWDFHKTEVTFEPERLTHLINMLESNRFNKAITYLQDKGISTDV